MITADHGEILGEGIPQLYELLHPRWPFRKRYHYDYAHYDHIRCPELVEVPWVELEVSTRRDVTEADTSEGIDMDEEAIESRLEALGYR